MTRSKFACAVLRMEAHVNVGGDNPPEEDLEWRLRVSPGKSDTVFVLGFLRKRSNGGFAQAQVAGGFPDESWRLIIESSGEKERFDTEVRERYSETLWDAARRNVQAQAALMDFELPLPNAAPEVELDWPE